MWQSMPASLHCAVWLAWQSLLWRVLAVLAPNYTQCRYVSGSVRCPLAFNICVHLNFLCTIVVNSHIHSMCEYQYHSVTKQHTPCRNALPELMDLSVDSVHLVLSCLCTLCLETTPHLQRRRWRLLLRVSLKPFKTIFIL